VIAALTKVGVPNALLTVTDERQQGPLLVTLALEVAAVAVSLLHENLAWSVGAEELERHYKVHGGNAYLDAFTKERDLHRSIEDLIAKAQKIENRILRLHMGDLTNRSPKKSPKSKCLNGGYISWKIPLCSEARELKKHYDKLVRALLSSRARYKKTADRLRSFRKEILGDAPALARTIKFDFDSSNPIMHESAVGILQRTERKWWRLFENAFQNEHHASVIRGLLGLILRDPAIQKATHIIRKHGVENARIDFIRRSKDYSTLQWPHDLNCIGILSSGNFRKRRHLLRKDDEDASAWIKRHAGPYHPCNLYGIDRCERPSVKQRHLINTYPAGRAINELYWCLCENTSENMKPLLSLRYSAEDWQKWQTSAVLGSPKYFRRPVP
jgi:hypothetical protein